MNNPFQHTGGARGVRALMWGAAGVGKTWLACQFPRPIAFIDTEGGAAPYRAAYAFDLQPAKTYAEVEALVRWVLAEGQGHYATLVIDSITVPYQMLLDAAQDANGRISHEKRAIVNRQMRALYNLLDQLAINLYVTARDKKVYEANERKGLDFAGLAPDADEELPHLFDLVFYAMGAAQGGVLKARVTKSRGLDKLDAVLAIDGQTFAERVAPAAAQLGCVIGEVSPPPDPPAPPTTPAQPAAVSKSANGRAGRPAQTPKVAPPAEEDAPEPEPPARETPPAPHWTLQPSAKHKGKTNWEAIVTAAARRWTYTEADLLRFAAEQFNAGAAAEIPVGMEAFWAALEAWDPTAGAPEPDPEPDPGPARFAWHPDVVARVRLEGWLCEDSDASARAILEEAREGGAFAGMEQTRLEAPAAAVEALSAWAMRQGRVRPALREAQTPAQGGSPNQYLFEM